MTFERKLTPFLIISLGDMGAATAVPSEESEKTVYEGTLYLSYEDSTWRDKLTPVSIYNSVDDPNCLNLVYDDSGKPHHIL